MIEVSIVIGDNQYIVPCGKSVGSLIEVGIVIGYDLQICFLIAFGKVD